MATSAPVPMFENLRPDCCADGFAPGAFVAAGGDPAEEVVGGFAPVGVGVLGNVGSDIHIAG